MTRGRHGFYAVSENGPAARSLAADAHRCIMVQAHPRPTEYKCVGLQPNGALPSDRQSCSDPPKPAVDLPNHEA